MLIYMLDADKSCTNVFKYHVKVGKMAKVFYDKEVFSLFGRIAGGLKSCFK